MLTKLGEWKFDKKQYLHRLKVSTYKFFAFTNGKTTPKQWRNLKTPMTTLSLPKGQWNMFKCNSLGFEEYKQIPMKVPSGTSRCVQVGGMRTWRVKKQKIFWRGLKNRCLSCAGRSTSEPQRVGDGLLPGPLSRRTHCSPLRECSPGRLLPTCRVGSAAGSCLAPAHTPPRTPTTCDWWADM